MEEKIVNSDKIYEGYKGLLGKEFQLKVYNRFLWMSEMVKGNNILDVGCSSGIFSILMAREGKKVIGLDVEKEAIDKANVIKREENDNVQNNVKFMNVSFSDFSDHNKYDTIIMSEVLEHLFYPRVMLEKAVSLLDDDGVIIITVPFGINCYFDHRKTYFISDLFRETSGLLKISDVKFMDEWLGVVCVKSNKEITAIPLEFIKKFEDALYEKEKTMYLSLHEKLQENSRQEKTIRENQEIVNNLNKVIEEYKQSIKENDEKMESFKNIISEKEEKINSLEETITLNDSRIKRLNREIKSINNRKIIRIIRKINRIKSGIANRLPSLTRKVKSNVFFEPKINMDFFETIDNQIANISESKSSNYYDKIDLKIGIITDEYMYNYYKDAVDLLYIPYNSYKEAIDKVDILLFVSCWHGMDNNDWRGMTSEIGPNKVIEAFNYAKSQNKKVIFQTIEDPSNYETYLPIAKEADYIFTTASEMIENYKQDTGNDNVYLLDYGVNPQFHNPVGFKNFNVKRKDEVFFAGSWAPRYKERCTDAMMLYDGVIESQKNLVIADRNFYNKGYEFPSRYYKYIIPAIEHEKLQKVHKLFDWSLNLNSIKYSPTMCAMRVYELQAIGNLLISNYSIAVNNVFPNIFIVKDSSEVSKILNSYSDIEIYQMQVDGIRNVMSHHTVYDKLNYIFKCIGEEKYLVSDKRVLVICKNANKKIKDLFEKQTYNNKTLIELDKIDSINNKEYNYIAFFDEEIAYSKNYLEDMINAFKYTNSDFICINSEIKNNEILGVNHDYVEECNNLGLVIFDANKYSFDELLKNNEIKGNGYSIDPFTVTPVLKTDKKELKLSVIVPIYNNGKFLLYKCFNSLKRSTIFENMEIILVDDGSTDEETITTINELTDKYSNVVSYFFKDGGSGSASRPRNKGVTLATTDYITYLDPDNEAINDGYTKLYDKVVNGDYDFAFGNIIKLSETENLLSYFFRDKEIENPRKELINMNFKTNSIQACVIKKRLIVDNKIENPVGAAGQDSLFFQELMLNAKKAYYLHLPIHIYYAARSGSVVNSINHKFFDKFLIMEKYQVKKLKEYNVFDEYYERRYHQFLENWYMTKLKLVSDDKEYEKSLEIIDEIRKLYEENN